MTSALIGAENRPINSGKLMGYFLTFVCLGLGTRLTDLPSTPWPGAWIMYQKWWTLHLKWWTLYSKQRALSVSGRVWQVISLQFRSFRSRKTWSLSPDLDCLLINLPNLANLAFDSETHSPSHNFIWNLCVNAIIYLELVCKWCIFWNLCVNAMVDSHMKSWVLHIKWPISYSNWQITWWLQRLFQVLYRGLLAGGVLPRRGGDFALRMMIFR